MKIFWYAAEVFFLIYICSKCQFAKSSTEPKHGKGSLRCCTTLTEPGHEPQCCSTHRCCATLTEPSVDGMSFPASKPQLGVHHVPMGFVPQPTPSLSKPQQLSKSSHTSVPPRRRFLVHMVQLPVSGDVDGAAGSPPPSSGQLQGSLSFIVESAGRQTQAQPLHSPGGDRDQQAQAVLVQPASQSGLSSSIAHPPQAFVIKPLLERQGHTPLAFSQPSHGQPAVFQHSGIAGGFPQSVPSMYRAQNIQASLPAQAQSQAVQEISSPAVLPQPWFSFPLQTGLPNRIAPHPGMLSFPPHPLQQLPFAVPGTSAVQPRSLTPILQQQPTLPVPHPPAQPPSQFPAPQLSSPQPSQKAPPAQFPLTSQTAQEAPQSPPSLRPQQAPAPLPPLAPQPIQQAPPSPHPAPLPSPPQIPQPVQQAPPSPHPARLPSPPQIQQPVQQAPPSPHPPPLPSPPQIPQPAQQAPASHFPVTPPSPPPAQQPQPGQHVLPSPHLPPSSPQKQFLQPRQPGQQAPPLPTISITHHHHHPLHAPPQFPQPLQQTQQATLSSHPALQPPPPQPAQQAPPAFPPLHQPLAQQAPPTQQPQPISHQIYIPHQQPLQPLMVQPRSRDHQRALHGLRPPQPQPPHPSSAVAY